MSSMPAGSRRIGLDLRHKPVASRRLRMRLLVPQRADSRDRNRAGEVVRGDVAGKLQRLDRGIADGLVDALEEWCHGAGYAGEFAYEMRR